jgi:alanyl-tRNA synthetase
LGDIGAVKIVSEASIGSNIRRIEAVTGFGPLERLRDAESNLATVAAALGVGIDEVTDSVERRLSELKDLQREVKALKAKMAAGGAGELVAAAVDGIVVARVDGVARDDLRNLAVAVRDHPGVRAVVLGGEPDGGGAALVAATTPDSDLDAGGLIDEAKALIKGGGGKGAELAMAGGKDASGLDAALDASRRAAGIG